MYKVNNIESIEKIKNKIATFRENLINAQRSVSLRLAKKSNLYREIVRPAARLKVCPNFENRPPLERK